MSAFVTGIRAAQLGLLVNALLVGAKMVGGILGNSYALIADAIESSTDVFSSLIVWGGLHVASRSADESHPYGHGKAESLAAAVVALMLLGAAASVVVLAVREIHTPHHAPERFTLIVLAAVVVVKEFLFRKVVDVGNEIGSTAVQSDAWHHRSDAFTSAAAFIGISIAIWGGPGWESADDWAALVAAVVIALNGAHLLKPAIDDLMDRMPDGPIIEQIERAAVSVDGVLAIEKLRVRKFGMEYFVDLHVQARPTISLDEAHIISGKVKGAIRTAVPTVTDASIHMEPFVPADANAPVLKSSALATNDVVESQPDDREKQYAALVAAIPQIVWTATPAGEINFANRRWYDATGFTPEQTMGTGWTAAVFPDDLPETLVRWKSALSSGQPVEVNWRMRMRDGSYRWQLARGVPLKDGVNVIRWLGTLTDIEDQKHAEEVLRETDRRKDEFLATLSHELRNPLAPISYMLQVLKRNPNQSESMTGAIATMDRQLKQLVRLVDDLLDVSRITQGKVEIHQERLNLASVVGQAVETCQALMDNAGQQLAINLPSSPVMLYGDRARLAQVFGNLLHNASKYTCAGGLITIDARRDGNDVVVSVSDNGTGIKPEMQAKIFELFTQSDPPPGKAPEGLGIGLSLARRFVEMHGGSITVQSDSHRPGSQFFVRLPIVDAPTDIRPASDCTQPLPTGGKSILVVDDNQDSASSLAALLEGLGYEVRTAADGFAAIAITANWRPRIIFCDLAMPGMHGNEVARHLRKQLDPSSTLLVALTGYGSATDRQRTFDAGFDYHLVKPLDPSALAAILATTTDDSQPR